MKTEPKTPNPPGKRTENPKALRERGHKTLKPSWKKLMLRSPNPEPSRKKPRRQNAALHPKEKAKAPTQKPWNLEKSAKAPNPKPGPALTTTSEGSKGVCCFVFVDSVRTEFGKTFLTCVIKRVEGPAKSSGLAPPPPSVLKNRPPNPSENRT